MAFGLNRAELIGRLGADVTVNQLASGGRVANLSVATDESFVTRDGERVDRTEWHRIVTFQDGLIDMLQKHATKGRLVYVAGKLQTRRWKKDGEDSDRFSTEILLVPGGRVQFLDKPNGNGAATQSGSEMAGQAGADHADLDGDAHTVLSLARHRFIPPLGRRLARRPIFHAAGPETAASERPLPLRAGVGGGRIGGRNARRRRETMAPVTDPANEPGPGDALAAMAGPHRDRVIEGCIENGEDESLLFDGPDIFGDLDAEA